MAEDPRGEGPVPSQVMALVIDGLREVKESISALTRDMNEQMSRLPDIYVPRREIDRRFDEHTIDIKEIAAGLDKKSVKHDADVHRLEQKHESDILRVDQAIKASDDQRKTEKNAADAQRKTDRRWAIGTALALAGLVLTALSIIVANH